MANWMRFLDDHFDDEVQNRAVGGNMSAVVFFFNFKDHLVHMW